MATRCAFTRASTPGTISGIDERDDVYNQLRDQLGAFVETAVVESDIDINN